MSREIGLRTALKVLTLILVLICNSVTPVFAQPVADKHRVLSVVEDAGGQFVMFNTSQLTPLAAPRMQYVPGAYGETVMALDFYGLSWVQPPRLIFPRVDGVKHVRIGQFQENPPICRISIASNQPGL